MTEGFECEATKNGYNIYNGIKGKVHYILADFIEYMYIGSLQEMFIKVTYKGKKGVILINYEEKKDLIEPKYLEIESPLEGNLIVCHSEEWDDIYDLKGTLIMSTK